MPTNTLQGNDPQTPILSAVRESQTAFIDVVRSWTDITEQLTRRLSLPVAGIDVAGALDRAFDLAEQTLAAQRQLALTLVGVVDRQVATAVEGSMAPWRPWTPRWRPSRPLALRPPTASRASPARPGARCPAAGQYG